MSLLLLAATLAAASGSPNTQVVRGSYADTMRPFAGCYRSMPTPVSGVDEATRRLGELPKANSYRLVMRSGPECMRPSDVRYNVEDQLRRLTPADGRPNRR